jgi:uncharacterized protein YeaO (DUF488 family)
VKIKRVYDSFSEDDGYRILVDRLWPRGVAKEAAHIDEWMKEIAPSTELRKWFNHDPALFPLFKEKYTEELRKKDTLLQHIKTIATSQKLTLLYSAKDELHNQAVVLLNVLKHY